MPRWLKWCGLWTLLGVVSSLPAGPHRWGQALAASLPAWYLWGLLSPVVAWLARRFRVDRASFGRYFFIHLDRKSTRLNSSHLVISYAVFCLKKKKNISVLRRGALV